MWFGTQCVFIFYCQDPSECAQCDFFQAMSLRDRSREGLLTEEKRFIV